ncbi:glycosyl hydrolase family 95 catalytic domain-containing protein [Pedobacter miscanthi]|uniref:glycosyl hydrolase family 95 catalytic domain-containing protein n=1 Tax=Pedobacter miscanthi TaxID=2259170 RepID=UPI0011BD7E4B|nr:hypothetical protein [Pedobacter miscanthi]
MPDNWDRGIFLGNGCLGTIFWVNDKGAFNFEVSRGDLYDHRNDIDGKAVLYYNNRLPNGHFELKLGGDKPAGSMRLNLWDAEATGKIKGGGNEYSLRCFTVADRNVIILEVTGDANHEIKWVPDTAKSTRKNPPKGYLPYPAQIIKHQGDISVSIQEMPSDNQYNTSGLLEGQYATAWSKQVQGNKTTYYISMGLSYSGRTADAEAVNLIRKAKKSGISVLQDVHRKWWHDYYPKSFISVPDGAMESFYWIQMYKMGSASRKGGPILDLMGPWFRPTVWPAIWWNLNIQLAYWPFYMSNHLDEAEPLARTVWDDRYNLGKNAIPYQSDSYAIGRATGPNGRTLVGSEVGNLPWVMHNLWMYYRSTMDDRYLKEQLFPLMKGSFNYLRHILIVAPDGALSLPKTASPEYTDGVENSNYTLACLRWLANTLIIADDRLKLNDPIVKDCRQTLDRLTPYEIEDKTGFMVGKNMPFVKSHRHWSHLFMIYPFHEYTWNNPTHAPLIKKSLENWISMPEAFAGYSWLGAASILEAGGRGDEALGFLRTFLKKSPQANTLYREGSPVIETPLAYGRTLQEMLMTSYGDTIRVFPGAPSVWENISFADLRAEGAFLVSARRKAGKTAFIVIESLKGEPCIIKTGFQEPVKATNTKPGTIVDLGKGTVRITLKKGEHILLYTGEHIPDTDIRPVELTGQQVSWGERKP